MDSVTNTNAQQFCLRWHNHQASLLSSLPLLLDQSHLTDVTISAEGRTIRAHRVVLSACSTFFCELFRTLEPPYHPVIVLPGASFSALLALLSFMYSGEVNVSEEQIPTLLSLAETLGIKGLADFNGNVPKPATFSPKREKDNASTTPIDVEEPPTSPTPTPTSTPVPSSHPVPPPSTKVNLSSPLDNLFGKSPFPFYPLLPAQPLNFSQHNVRLASDLFAKFNNQLLNNAGPKMLGNSEARSPESDGGNTLDDDNANRASRESKANKIRSELKRIDKIAENLRTTNKFFLDQHQFQLQKSFNSLLPQHLANSPLLLKPPMASCSGGIPNFLQPNANVKDLELKMELNNNNNENTPSLSNPPTPTGLGTKTENNGVLSSLVSNSNNDPQNLVMDKSYCNPLAPVPNHPPNVKPSNSKLFATCFICHKQLSNQYNLRVHLETHQNVRYACTVCTHVSRSKDALRKHVSYRHPGAPSPCESETRRKRNKLLSQQQQQQLQSLQIKQEMIDVQNFINQQQQQQQLMALAASSVASPSGPPPQLGINQPAQMMSTTPPVTPTATEPMTLDTSQMVKDNSKNPPETGGQNNTNPSANSVP